MYDLWRGVPHLGRCVGRLGIGVRGVADSTRTLLPHPLPLTHRRDEQRPHPQQLPHLVHTLRLGQFVQPRGRQVGAFGGGMVSCPSRLPPSPPPSTRAACATRALGVPSPRVAVARRIGRAAACAWRGSRATGREGSRVLGRKHSKTPPPPSPTSHSSIPLLVRASSPSAERARSRKRARRSAPRAGVTSCTAVRGRRRA